VSYGCLLAAGATGGEGEVTRTEAGWFRDGSDSREGARYASGGVPGW
jgi:hypothetical protein